MRYTVRTGDSPFSFAQSILGAEASDKQVASLVYYLDLDQRFEVGHSFEFSEDPRLYMRDGDWHESRIVYADEPSDRRLNCNYCGQQNTIENFDGGCKNCGAPAPRR